MRAAIGLVGHMISWSQAAGIVALKVAPGARNLGGKRAEAQKVLPLGSQTF